MKIAGVLRISGTYYYVLLIGGYQLPMPVRMRSRQFSGRERSPGEIGLGTCRSYSSRSCQTDS